MCLYTCVSIRMVYILAIAFSFSLCSYVCIYAVYELVDVECNILHIFCVFVDVVVVIFAAPVAAAIGL